MMILTDDQLNNLNREALVIIVASLQDQIASMQGQLDTANAQLSDTNRQIELLTEQLRLMNQRRFGRKAESDLYEMDGQLTLFDSFNEVEFSQNPDAPEPTLEEITISSYRRSKTKGKRDADLDGLPARIFEHRLSEENLAAKFPGATRNFRLKSTSVSTSFRKPSSWMNTMSMYMPPDPMMVPS